MTSRINEFYKNTNILITGGTGFLGKILIQKLLRECDGIKNIYLIVREKKGNNIHLRLDDMFKDVIFNKLKEHNEHFINKITLVEGDCSKLDLGLSKMDKNTLTKNINIVFHMAASLNMDSHLRDAVMTNVQGTKEMIQLCHEMEHLKSVVYVSTAYSNCHLPTIDELFYKPKISGETLIKLTEEVDDKCLDKLTPILLGDMPNTYVFTKCVSEDLICKNGIGLPLAVFRPSIVQPSYQDPIPGWTDNYYGPTGIAIAIFHGIIRTAICNRDMHIDIIPADYCANALISCAWDSQKEVTNKSLMKYPIYNYAAGIENAPTWGEYSDKLKIHLDVEPVSKTLWPAHYHYISNVYQFYLYAAIVHYLPAFIMDAFLVMRGKKAKMVRLYNKLHKLIFILKYFSLREFDFKSNNVTAMWMKLNETDKNKFPFDVKSIDYDTYTKNIYSGVKYYLIKDDPKDLTKAIRRYKILHVIEKMFGLALIVFSYFIIYKLFLSY